MPVSHCTEMAYGVGMFEAQRAAGSGFLAAMLPSGNTARAMKALLRPQAMPAQGVSDMLTIGNAMLRPVNRLDSLVGWI